MKKVAAAITATLLQAANTAAHMTHQQEPATSQGVHATNFETFILALLTVLAVGMIYYGLANATDAIPQPGTDEPEEDKEAGESDEESGDEE